MIRKQVTRQALDAWVDGLIAAGRVVGAQKKGGRYAFDDLRRAADLCLDYDVTILPPKKYFLPPKEDILRFSDGRYESVSDAAPFTLLGVHPYDMAAIAQMDKLFAQDNRDEHYLARREQATVVVCDIERMSPNIFAASVGTATAADGCDALITRVGRAYVIESHTAKGERLLAGLAGAPDADAVTLARREQLWEDNARLMSRRELRVEPRRLPRLLEDAYDHPVWEEKASQCFACGSCNLVCPTCYCFDVQDDVEWDPSRGVRRRVWDGCMLTDFATVAGKHNFRKNRADRYRHRYYRKGKYVPEKIGDFSCVGCGRCVSACVARIADPVEVYNRIAEVQ
ncbi:MAG: Ni/Fe hydrogenase subunit beta [Lentisphaerae bacterium]|nr:Ni/Fe hydrogenase subunit beta [Lentisphaerota bacterium]